ncbi:hypothetical protein O9992_22830 [Vibrio lentus]|nr:hypothetical protein [Vibrio lentus]
MEVKVSAKDIFMEDFPLQRLLAARLDTYIREELSLDYSPYTYQHPQDSELSGAVIGAMVAPENGDG